MAISKENTEIYNNKPGTLFTFFIFYLQVSQGIAKNADWEVVEVIEDAPAPRDDQQEKS